MNSGFAGFMDGFEDLTEAQKAADADPDGDGIHNLLEYALDGLNPGVPNILPSLQDGSVSFAKRELAVNNGDVNYLIETSTTLEPDSWTEVEAEETTTTISNTLPTWQSRNSVRLRVVLSEWMAGTGCWASGRWAGPTQFIEKAR